MSSYSLLVEEPSNGVDFPNMYVDGPYGTWDKVESVANNLLETGAAKYVEIFVAYSGKTVKKLGEPWYEESGT